MSKSSWSGTAADWDQRFEVGDVVADPSGSWTPSTAEAYIDSQVATLNTSIASEVIARQAGDNNLSTQLSSEMNTRASQDANLNALINAGIREGGGVQFDIVPTQNSANGITSGGMYSTLKDSGVGFVDDIPTAGSNNLVKSGGVLQTLMKSAAYSICYSTRDRNSVSIVGDMLKINQNGFGLSFEYGKYCWIIGDFSILFNTTYSNGLIAIDTTLIGNYQDGADINASSCIVDIGNVYTLKNQDRYIPICRYAYLNNYKIATLVGQFKDLYDHENFEIATGDVCTNNNIINAVFPSILATEDVVSIDVIVSSNGSLEVTAKDANNQVLLNRNIQGVLYTDGIIELCASPSITLSDVLLLFNKNAFIRLIEGLGYPNGSNSETFTGILNQNSFDLEKNAPVFSKYKQEKDWGTTSGTIERVQIGINIYNVVDCFRFPAKVTSITIPAEKDGIVEIYRSRLLDVDGVSETILIETLKVKKGEYKYNVSIDMNAGEGIAFCAQNIMTTNAHTGWRIAGYFVNTLKRDGGVSGWGDGSINCSIEYYFLAEKGFKDLSGLNISIIGDSISTFGSDYSYSDPYYPMGDIYNVYETWWGRLMQDGVKVIKNESESQSTIVNRTGSDARKWIGYNDRISNLGNGGNAPDVILVLAGINDMFSGDYLGDFDFTKKITDFSGLDTFSFKQSYQYIVMTLLTLYPSSKIYICTPFKVGNTNWGFPEQNGNRFLYQINNAIKELAEVMGVGFIDFYNEVNISYIQMKNGDFGDTIHPNRLGHYLYYKIAKRYLLELVK